MKQYWLFEKKRIFQLIYKKYSFKRIMNKCIYIMCSHQDFKEITLGKSSSLNTTQKKPQISRELKKMNLLENDEVSLPQNTSLTVRKQLEDGRRLKNLTQTEFAKQLGIKVIEYNRIESGKEPLEGNLKAKIQKILNIKIQKEKKPAK